MNPAFKILPVTVVLLLTACTNKTDETTQNAKTEVSLNENADTLSSELPTNLPVFNSITGVVEAIQPGKDGYTAKVKTRKQETVFVTVSRVNLKDPKQYRSVQVGDTLEALGEEWEMNGETHLKALELN
jgi:hypothetical protein